MLPVVLHADTRPWRSPRNVRELFDLDRIPEHLHRYLPSLPYVLDDLREQPPERLRQRALTVFGLCALSALQYLPPAARDEHTFDAFLTAWHDVQEQATHLGTTDSGRELFEALVDYILATSGLPAPVVQRLLVRPLPNPAMKNRFVSTAQQLRNEGRSQGKAEGLAEGRANTLLHLITRRFGTPAAAVVERVRTATLAELDRWTDRILDAATLDELFAD